MYSGIESNLELYTSALVVFLFDNKPRSSTEVSRILKEEGAWEEASKPTDPHCCGYTGGTKANYSTGDCGGIFPTWKRIANHIREVTFTNQNPWNGLHVAKIPQSPVTSPIPRVLIGGHDPPLCFTCCKDSAISCTHLLNSCMCTWLHLNANSAMYSAINWL